MTNIEKFEEVFGFTPSPELCLIPKHIVPCYLMDLCEECTYGDWWHWEYREEEKKKK